MFHTGWTMLPAVSWVTEIVPAAIAGQIVQVVLAVLEPVVYGYV